MSRRISDALMSRDDSGGRPSGHALAVAGIAASATTVGVETDIVGASRRLPHTLLVVAPRLALFALFILPVALAVQLLVRRQPRRLAEAVATGVLAGAATAVVNVL